ncbi:hypothetical protein KY346_06020 [Candidatus Woesearchaeota archaeon]|nr:hypothetical protein [Candidatus Woesearchaeota archaeon]
MTTSKIIVTIIGAVLVLIGIGGVPIYVVERDLIRTGIYTMLLIAGIAVLGYSAQK